MRIPGQKEDIREFRSGLCLKACSFGHPWFIQKESESGHRVSFMYYIFYYLN